jgi:ankyrin repeat protein
MHTFVSSGDRNYFRNFCKELDATQIATLPKATVYPLFIKTGVLIGKVDESKWTILDLQLVCAGIDEQLKTANTKLDQSQQDISSLPELEDMMHAFKKIEKVASDLLAESTEIVIRNGLRIFTFEQTLAILSNNTIFHNIHALLEKTRRNAFEILVKASPDVNCPEKVETEHSFLHAAIRENKKDLALKLIRSGINLEVYDAAGNTPLTSLCIKGDIDLVTAILDNGADVNKKNRAGTSPLHKACAHGHLNIVKLLIRNGAQINTRAANENTPLITACRKGSLEIVAYLLAHGAYVDWKGHREQSALSKACSIARLDIVQELLRYGADVDNEDEDGYTPLLQALINDGVDIAQVLLTKGADPNKQTERGTAALHLACRDGLNTIVEDLLNYGANPNITDAEGDTPLLLACCKGSLEAVQALLEKGADIQKKYHDNKTILHTACYAGHYIIVEELLNYGAITQMNRVDAYGNTPIMAACKNGYLEIFKAFGLLTSGNDINKKKQVIQSSFLSACSGGHLPIIQWFLEHDVYHALINFEDAKGNTPLLVVCENERLEALQALVAKGATVNKKNKFGKTALHIACSKQNLHIVQELLKQHAQIDIQDNKGMTPLRFAYQKGYINITHALLNHKDESGKTALHRACGKGSLCKALELLEYGAPVDIEDTKESTPFIEACSHGHLEVASCLQAKGADVNKKNSHGMSALYSACFHEHLHVVQWLLEHGALVDSEHNNGSTPLHAACNKGNIQIAQALLAKGADVNKQNRQGATTVAFALKKETPGFIKLLIESNVKESYFYKYGGGTTPLHKLFAKPALLEQEALADLFLKLCPMFDVTCKDTNKLTPLRGTSQTNRDQLFKRLFRDFGVIDEVINAHGANVFLTYFQNHPQDLIAHPQNHPKANPLSPALLFDSRTLAHAIACKLTTEEFMKKCHELEKAYPKTPVLEFLFDSFIRSPTAIVATTLLPNGHISALFSYLCKKIDVTKQNEGCRTPLYNLLCSIGNFAVHTINEVLGKFGAVQKRLSEHATEGFLDYFIECPETLIEDPENLPNVNPLEVAFLFGNLSLARAIACTITKGEFQALALKLEKSFPKSQAAEFIFNVEFSVNLEHITKGVTVIPEKPQGVEARDLLTLFDKINFVNPNKPLYFNPEAHGLKSDPIQLRKILEDFITKIETRQEYTGTPKKDTDAIKVFYKIIENAVTNVIQKLQSSDEKLRAKTVIDYLREVALCGGKIFAISVEIFNKVVHNVQADFENRAFASLGELRSMLARDAIPTSKQSVHDYNRFLRAKGKKLGIPGSEEGEQYEDMYVGTTEFNADKSEKKFLGLYTPAAIALKWLEPQFRTDASLRERYAEWWKQDVPKEWGEEKYGSIQEKIEELRATATSAVVAEREIAKYLESQDIYVGNNQNPEEIVEDARTHAFIESEVYNDMAANTFKITPFAQSLVKIGVLSPAPIAYMDNFLI